MDKKMVLTTGTGNTFHIHRVNYMNFFFLMSFSTILVEPNCTASITKCGDIEIQVSDSLLFFYRICSFRFIDLIQLVQLKNEYSIAL